MSTACKSLWVLAGLQLVINEYILIDQAWVWPIVMLELINLTTIYDRSCLLLLYSILNVSRSLDLSKTILACDNCRCLIISLLVRTGDVFLVFNVRL